MDDILRNFLIFSFNIQLIIFLNTYKKTLKVIYYKMKNYYLFIKCYIKIDQDWGIV